jgi:hypothetical protein
MLKMSTSLDTLASLATTRFFNLPHVQNPQFVYSQWLETHSFAVHLEGNLGANLAHFSLNKVNQPIIFIDHPTKPDSLLLRWDSHQEPSFWLEVHLNLDDMDRTSIRGSGVPHDHIISDIEAYDTYPAWYTSPIATISWDSPSCASFWLKLVFYIK